MLPHLLQIYRERLNLQAEFDTFLTDQVTELIFKSRTTYYEQGDKAGKLLAQRLRQISASHPIQKIHTCLGTTLYPRGINDEFMSFYQSLYTSEREVNIIELDDFFHSPFSHCP